MLDFTYVNTLTAYDAALVALAPAIRLAVDCETYTDHQYENASYDADSLRTNPHTGLVSLVAVAMEGAAPYVFDLVCLEALGYDPNKLGNLLRSKQYLIAHNAKFEAKLLWRHFNWIHNWHCTLIRAQLYANATGSKLWRARGMGLADLCRDWLNVVMEGKGSLQITQWYSAPAARSLDNPVWVEKLGYAAKDTQYLFQLHDILTGLVANPLPPSSLIPTTYPPDFNNQFGWGMGLTLMGEDYLTSLVAQMEVQGLPYSELVEAKFIQAVHAEHKRLGIAICKELNLGLARVGVRGGYAPSNDAAVVLNNPVKLCKLINQSTHLKLNNSQGAILRRALAVLEELTRAEQAAKDADIEFIEGEDEVFSELANLSTEAKAHSFHLLKQIIDYKRLTKQRGMFLKPYVNPASKRIHPQFSQLRASTGRFGASNPNAQQISCRLSLVVEFTMDELAQLIDIA